MDINNVFSYSSKSVILPVGLVRTKFFESEANAFCSNCKLHEFLQHYGSNINCYISSINVVLPQILIEKHSRHFAGKIYSVGEIIAFILAAFADEID